MKRQFFSRSTLAASTLAASTLAASVLTGLSAAPAQAQANPAFAQQLLTDVFAGECDRATEVTYRSNQLSTHSQAGTRVSVEAILRKIVTPGSPLRPADTATNCAPDARQTSAQQLVIRSPTEIRRVTLSPQPNSYLFYHLQSFSPSGDYLVADLQSVHTGGNGGNFITIFDLSGTNVSVSTPDVCEELDLASYYGFASATEVIVRCQGYLASSQSFEAVNVETGTVRQLAAVPNVTNYGLAAGVPAITKIQRFQ